MYNHENNGKFQNTIARQKELKAAFDMETIEQYLTRIGAKNNTPITEDEWVQECQREDAP